jgi:DNA replication protein DnaC
MNCLVNQCDGSGLIPVGDKFNECQCKYIRTAYRIYDKSGANPNYRIFTEDLEKNPLITNVKKEKLGMKDLLHLLIENGNLDKLVKGNWFLYLVGSVGTGKSQFSSTFLLEAAFFRKYTSKFIDERSLEHIVFHTEKKNKLLDEVENVDILVIDDIGVSGKSSHNVNMVQSVVNLLDYIIRNHKGLIIFTSNLKPSSLEQAYGVAQTDQLISMITKGKRKVYLMDEENIRLEVVEEDSITF